MSKYSSKDLDLNFGAQSMKAHIIDDVNLAVEVGMEESTAFGDSWAFHISTGIKRGDAFTVGGFYDTTGGTGPDVKFSNGLAVLGTSVATIITWGGGKTSTFDSIVTRYERIGSVNQMTRYVATLLPTGAVTEA